jgi:DNA-binding MurR/RpiR family transcriptional regulator
MDKALSIEEKMRAALPDLTRAERQAATHILSHFPMSALGSITALARAAEVSTPTVVRLVQKLGYRGYTDYQTALRGEVETMLVSPLAKPPRLPGDDGGDGGDHVLIRFAGPVMANLQATIAQIDPATFDRVAAILADPERRVLALGGRLTHAHADYFVTLMRVARPGVALMAHTGDGWPAAMLDVAPGDAVVLFDVRRYETTVVQVAELAAQQGAEVILITDRWHSPAAQFASHILACNIEVPLAWDSTVSILFLVETLLTSVQALGWGEAEDRLKRLEDMYARTRFFRRK